VPVLTDNEIENIINLLKEGKHIPDDYKTILFETKKEYELVYADKSREEDILAETMAMPLQKVKNFRSGDDGNDWTNMLIFGENLQFLKTLLQMKQEGKLNNADGIPGVRLIYIDPPFATRQEFRGSQDQKAYQDKIAGARFLDFLRKRLIFLRELLSDDGSIYVHLDWKKGHYVKTLMDEIFGEQNFRNEVLVRRTAKHTVNQFEKVSSLQVVQDSILIYTVSSEVKFNPPLREASKKQKQGSWHDLFNRADRPTMRYPLLNKNLTHGQWMWKEERSYQAVENYKEYEKKFSHLELRDYWKNTGKTLEFVRPKSSTGMPEYWVKAKEMVICDSNWLDVQAYSFSTGYPTEKSEKLLDRIIKSGSNHGDIILDCFAGSGTTVAVAEKLGRRWIGVDCGKFAIYTMQKRLLNIAKSRNLENKNKKYGKKCTPFILYNAGLYDYNAVKELPWENYREFALKLFQCRDEQHSVSKIELDGFIGADHVKIFNYKKNKNARMDRGFIDDLHRHLGDKVGRRFFIIAPAGSVGFLEDYIEKGKTKYFVLRIPYSIIDEIHKVGFTKIKQPISEKDVNDTVDSVGFDFIQLPTVECRFLIVPKKGQVQIGAAKNECLIKIERFESKVISRKPIEFANLETLSMVMLDYDFDGNVFDMDDVFYSDDLKKNDHTVRFDEDKISGEIMIIYLDIFGNEKREVKTLSDFKVERKKEM